MDVTKMRDNISPGEKGSNDSDVVVWFQPVPKFSLVNQHMTSRPAANYIVKMHNFPAGISVIRWRGVNTSVLL